MPNEQDASDGLTALSLHAFEESSSGAIEQQREERAPYPGSAPDTAALESELGPETAARRYPRQALDSAAVPALTVERHHMQSRCASESQVPRVSVGFGPEVASPVLHAHAGAAPVRTAVCPLYCLHRKPRYGRNV